MNPSTRPTYKHNLLCLPPFDLTDRSETRQQAPILHLSHYCRLLHILVSRILRSFEFDGQKFSIHCVQSNSIQSSLRNLCFTDASEELRTRSITRTRYTHERSQVFSAHPPPPILLLLLAQQPTNASRGVKH
jgi:hypothetical protein